MSIAAPTPLAVAHEIHDTAYIHGATVNGVETDTVYIKAPFWIIDTVRETDTVVKQPAPFSLPSVFAAAVPIIAHLEPQEPANVLELYGHAAHDFFQGGYSGGAELDLRLDQVHVAPITVFTDLGYDKQVHFEVGARGKFWGIW